MNYLLSPDKNNNLLKKYHASSKLLLPGLLTSYLCNKYEKKTIGTVANIFNVFNITYHSYVSTSCIITDYVKSNNISKLFRYTNLNLHCLACIGYIYYTKKSIKIISYVNI